jgi:lipocalin
VSAKTREQLLSIARERGYATEGLIWRVADQSIGQP